MVKTENSKTMSLRLTLQASGREKQEINVIGLYVLKRIVFKTVSNNYYGAFCENS